MKNTLPFILLAFLAWNCTGSQPDQYKNREADSLKAKADSLQVVLNEMRSGPGIKIRPFFTFQDNTAEEAMKFYTGLFDNSTIGEVTRYGKDGPGKEGSVMLAAFTLDGKGFLCSDSYIRHDWDFTPAISMYVECQTAEELEMLSDSLSEGGTVFMPAGDYGFSRKFAWVGDRFGISWQLNLP